MRCPDCGSPLDRMGLAPGAEVTCPCGHESHAPRSPLRKRIFFVLGLLACLFLGVVTANTLRQFSRFGQRTRASECKANLKAWYRAQRDYYQDTRTYEPVFAKVGFAPERNNRYAYFAGRGPMEVRDEERSAALDEAVSIGVDTFRFTQSRAVGFESLPSNVKSRLGVSGRCPDCDITLACAGNTDDDETLDVWVLSTGSLDLQDDTGGAAEPGVPLQVVDDTER